MAASDQFYIDLLAEVNPLLDEFGTTYTINTPGVYDNNELTTLPPTQRTAVGLVADSKTLNGLGLSSPSDAGALQWTSTRNLLLRNDTLPLNDETIVVDGRTFNLNELETIKPADIIVLYILDISS